MSWITAKLRSNDEGFTLLELMIVLVVLAVIALIAVPAYLTTRQQSMQKAHNANIEGISRAIDCYYAERKDLTALALPLDSHNPLVVGGFLKDPPTVPYESSQYYTLQLGASTDTLLISPGYSLYDPADGQYQANPDPTVVYLNVEKPVVIH